MSSRSGALSRWWGAMVLLLGVALSAACAPAATTSATTGASQAGAKNRSQGLLGQGFRFRFSIFMAEEPALDVGKELQSALAGTDFRVAPLPMGDGLPPSPTSIFFARPSIEEFAPPERESLEHFVSDMNEQEMLRLTQSRAVAVFEVAGAASRAHDDYRAALLLAEKLARKLNGFVWDEETRTAFTVTGWARRRDGFHGKLPDVTEHVTIHSYRDGELIRLVSLGMIKLGLPDVAITQVSSSDTRQMANLLNLVMQRLAEGATLDAQGRMRAAIAEVEHTRLKEHFLSDLIEGAKRELVVTLVPREPDEGDADNRLLELVFPGDPRSLQERHSVAIAELFGAKDAVENVEHDQELLAASARARASLFKLKPSYAESPPYGDMLLVKAPFVTSDGGNEWMWVEVISWKGETVDGILQNEPFHVPGLKIGARVQVNEADLFDYVLTHRDGSQEGNETGKVMERRSKKR